MTEMQANPPEFTAATDAINQTIDTLGGKSGNLGRGFSDFALSPKEASKAEAQQASEEFAERWEWGVRALCQSANNFAQALGLAAGLYYREDEQASTMFKTIYTNLVGNPHLSSDEIGQRNWEETLADNPVNNLMNPDFSKESFDEMVAGAQNNGQIISDSAPQAFSNFAAGMSLSNAGLMMSNSSLLGLPAPSFNSGQMEQAAQTGSGE